MIRLDGNSILIVDGDKDYGTQLCEVLSLHGAKCNFAENMEESIQLMDHFDFDLVVSNYYLNDALIFQLIDWIHQNKQVVPVFTCVGYPLPGDIGLSRRQSIATVFSKNDKKSMLVGISHLLFDFQKFHDSLVEIMTPIEVQIKIQIDGAHIPSHPIELTEETLFMDIDEEIVKGSFGILKFSLSFTTDGEVIERNFVIPGLIKDVSSAGYVFEVNKNHKKNWAQFLDWLNVRQLNITSFLKKTIGH